MICMIHLYNYLSNFSMILNMTERMKWLKMTERMKWFPCEDRLKRSEFSLAGGKLGKLQNPNY